MGEKLTVMFSGKHEEGSFPFELFDFKHLMKLRNGFAIRRKTSCKVEGGSV
jgi:hypothetical protein